MKKFYYEMGRGFINEGRLRYLTKEEATELRDYNQGTKGNINYQIREITMKEINTFKKQLIYPIIDVLYNKGIIHDEKYENYYKKEELIELMRLYEKEKKAEEEYYKKLEENIE